MDDPGRLTETVKRLAGEVGFDRAGVAAAGPLKREEFLRSWLAAGYAGWMDYLARNLEQRNDPRLLLDGARSVICLAANYRDPGPDDRAPAPPGAGYVARYARGRDYHDVLRKRAGRLVERLRGEIGLPFAARVCVDTAPVLERELAGRAGLGWIGKNTALIHPAAGSYFFLCEIITTLHLAADEPMPNHCGRCRRCLDACPTQAFVRPRVLNASRCISYLTIEAREEFPPALAEKVAPHLFGCDLCQAVCPFNEKFSRPTDDAELVPPEAAQRANLDLQTVAGWTEADYRRELAGRAGKRAKLAMWKRNAANASR